MIKEEEEKKILEPIKLNKSEHDLKVEEEMENIASRAFVVRRGRCKR